MVGGNSQQALQVQRALATVSTLYINTGHAEAYQSYNTVITRDVCFCCGNEQQTMELACAGTAVLHHDVVTTAWFCHDKAVSKDMAKEPCRGRAHLCMYAHKTEDYSAAKKAAPLHYCLLFRLLETAEGRVHGMHTRAYLVAGDDAGANLLDQGRHGGC